MPRALQPIKMPGNTVLRRTMQLLQQEMLIEDEVLEAMREDGTLDTFINEELWSNIEVVIFTGYRSLFCVLLLSFAKLACSVWNILS